ncbi:anthranilate synthase component I family protein [Lacunimicrobium album]
MLPLKIEMLDAGLRPVEAAKSLSGLRGLILLESVTSGGALSRYSYLMAEPVETVTLEAVEQGSDPFETLRRWSLEYAMESDPALPPFQGGIAGHLSYEVGRAFEKLSTAEFEGLPIPAMQVGVYPWVVAWDHVEGTCRLVVREGLCGEVEGIINRLRSGRTRSGELGLGIEGTGGLHPPLALKRVSVREGLSVLGNFDQQEYEEAVRRVIEYIRAGDIFQANLSQQFWLKAERPPLELYETLRRTNPAPFAALLQGDGWGIVSSSPERFLQVTGGQVTTRPIKGTRRRLHRPEADLYQREDLATSAKDRAENIMIVDLMRNDLSRVCQPGSVRVPKLCIVEEYETVQHLVSEVTGTLEPGRDVWDLLAATFPGGSITGAPKIRAMEIITELERLPRGPYCGSLFWRSWNGDFDSSILIRTISQAGGWLTLPVGGGVTCRSNPADEYRETLDKAAGMLRAFG